MLQRMDYGPDHAIIKRFPLLYIKENFGDLHTIQLNLCRKEGLFYLITYKALIGTKPTSTIHLCKIGKRKELLESEAETIATSNWENHLTKGGYTKNKSGEPGGLAPLPMLAKLFQNEKHKLAYPVLTQPKLNGFRCMAIKQDGIVSCWSKVGNRFQTTLNIELALQDMMVEGECVDGELYKHGVPFEELSGSIRNVKNNASVAELHLYDIVGVTTPQVIRIAKLQAYASRHELIKVVETKQAKSEEEVLANSAEYVRQGYEGGMVRTLYDFYRINYRNAKLLKVKNFDETEFEVVSFTNGKGTDEGCVIWVCGTPLNEIGDRRTFNVRPRGTLKRRAEQFKNGYDYIGKFLTVRHLGLNKSGIPNHATGLKFKGDLE